MKKKILTLLILAAMLVCLLPTAAFALKPGDALPYSKYCSACGQTALHMYLDGYTKGTYNASSGDYFHIIHAHDDWEHTLDHEQHCFTPRFGDYTIEYAQLSASSGQDPARYHKATCVCGLSLNKEHNYSEYQSGKRSCSDCGYVQTCDHSGNTNPTCLSTTCSVCGGSGRVTISQRSPFGVVQTQRACDACHGKGMIIDSPCPKCGGSGRKRKTRTVDITVPAGIKGRQILNVGGRGNAGYNGGPSGDLHVYVNVQPHPVFERRGDDVWCNLPLTFAQAALGAEVVVPTLDGKVSYQVHEGTQPGDVFKLKGKGIQRLNGRGKGDQYVRVTIEVPKNLNAKQKNLIKEFENVTNEKNYAQRNSFFEKIKRMFNE